MADILQAFAEATRLQAPHLAGALVLISAALGGVLLLMWLFHISHMAASSSVTAPKALALVIGAFSTLLILLGVFYDH